MSIAPSGQQFEITSGQQRVTIVEVGGGIRCYDDGDRPVLQPYPEHAMCDGAHGAPLIPWPNRLGEGRYRFGDVDHRVALTEPDKSNAIHGFLRWRSWHPIHQASDQITMATTLYPLEGYPFTLDVQIAYALSKGGLTVRTTATNIGDSTCPYGCGQHPYLSPGAGRIDDCVLRLDAATWILTDKQQQLPTGTQSVDGTAFDFRSGKQLGDVKIDNAFTGLNRDQDGRAWVRLAAPDGYTAELWVDSHYPIIELYTGDTLAPDRRRRGLGTEPMTCPPNAFQSGTAVMHLDPGESVTTEWGVHLAGTGPGSGG